MKFSVCIPNFNYQAYLGKTLDSVLASSHTDLEILISDNASTDRSVDIVLEYQKRYPAIHLSRNPVNVGFSGNLDRAAAMASGDNIIMLSSDDLVGPATLSAYASVLKDNPGSIVCSSWDIIDSDGNKTGYNGPNPKLWYASDKDDKLSLLLEANVYRVRAADLLKRCIGEMATPFNFCTVAYRKEWYLSVGGYGGGRLINPDKWFHWKLLTRADDAVFIDKPLFQYRWHNQNQSAQQANSGHLKYLVDEYRNIIELQNSVIESAGIRTSDAVDAFIRKDIYRHGIGEFSRGRWTKSLRIFFFGLATFPWRMITKPQFVPYIFVLLTTPLGARLISIFRK